MTATPDAAHLIMQNLAASLMAMLIWAGVAHVYLATMLTIIAARTRTQGAVLAWFPIINVFFICTLGRRSPALALLLLIPIVNIVVAVMMWMAVAEVCGKRGFIGALAVVPVLGLLVPLHLALTASPSASRCPHCRADLIPGDTFCGACGNSVIAPAPTAAVTCTTCGDRLAPGDTFCAACGSAVAPAAAPLTRTLSSGPRLALSAVAMTAVLVVLCGGAGFYALTRALAYTPPARKAPALPKRMAGMLREFPVDTDAANPAAVKAVVSQDFTSGSGSKALSVGSSWLPTGFPSAELPRLASSMTSAEYGRRSPAGERSTSRARSYVHVVKRRRPSHRPSDELERMVARSTGGKRTGISVQSPSGATYVGSRIDTGKEETFVLGRPDSDTVVLVHAPDSEGRELTERLAQNVGNGEGLNDNPEARDELAALPADLPPGFETISVGSIDLAAALEEASQGGSTPPQDVDKALAPIRRFLPGWVTTAEYRSSGGGEWRAAVLDYGDPRQAANLWLLMRYTVGLGMSEAQQMPDLGARLVDFGDGKGLAFRKGPYIVVVTGPSSATAEQLAALASAMQM